MRICHPASWRGSGYFLFQTQSSAANAAPLWAMGMSPVSRALNTARLRLAKFQFIEISTQTLGHVYLPVVLCVKNHSGVSPASPSSVSIYLGLYRRKPLTSNSSIVNLKS